jgi:hypothetical protein
MLANNAQADAVNPALVRFVEVAKGFLVTRLRPADEFELRCSVGWPLLEHGPL